MNQLMEAMSGLTSTINNTNTTMNSLTTHVRDKFNSFEYSLANMQASLTGKVDNLTAEVSTVKEVVSSHHDKIIKLEADIQSLRGRQGANPKSDPNSEKSFLFFNWPYSNGQPLDLFTKWNFRQ